MDDRYIKVKDHEDLVKDSHGNAILNADVNAFESFKHRKKKERDTENRLSEIENNIDTILSSIDALSKLIQEKL